MFWKLQENIITASDLDLLVEFIRGTKRFTQYTKVAAFEEAFAAWQGCRYCVYVNSGSAANLILINAVKELYGWQDGDEVIVPAVTWPTTITPVMQCGLTPVFVDVNLSDFSMNYDMLGSKITDRTKAIFVAHLLGFPADINLLKEIISTHEIVILEDCCESQGATIDGTKVGNLGLAGTFSFYWGHHMTTVEGGMLCTNNEMLYNLLLLKRSHGLARELPAKQHEALKKEHEGIDFNFLFLTDGFNVRNTEFNAVIGLSQLERIDNYITIRNKNYSQFLKMCTKYEKYLVLLDSPGISSFVLPFVFKNRELKEAFQLLIRKAGIESRPLISGNLLRQPFLSKYNNCDEFKCADFLHTNAFYIGNNQFVDSHRLEVLATLMDEFFENIK